MKKMRESFILLIEEAYLVSTCLVVPNYLKKVFIRPGVFLQKTVDQII